MRDLIRSCNVERDAVCVTVGLYDEVEFELALLSVESEVDTGINSAIIHARELLHVAPQFLNRVGWGGSVADQLVGARDFGVRLPSVFMQLQPAFGCGFWRRATRLVVLSRSDGQREHCFVGGAGCSAIACGLPRGSV